MVETRRGEARMPHHLRASCACALPSSDSGRLSSSAFHASTEEYEACPQSISRDKKKGEFAVNTVNIAPPSSSRRFLSFPCAAFPWDGMPVPGVAPLPCRGARRLRLRPGRTSGRASRWEPPWPGARLREGVASNKRSGSAIDEVCPSFTSIDNRSGADVAPEGAPRQGGKGGQPYRLKGEVRVQVAVVHHPAAVVLQQDGLGLHSLREVGGFAVGGYSEVVVDGGPCGRRHKEVVPQFVSPTFQQFYARTHTHLRQGELPQVSRVVLVELRLAA